MTERENKCTREGYRWRDELVKTLLPYMKDEIPTVFPSKPEIIEQSTAKTRVLNNLLRGYIPCFFPSKSDNVTDTDNVSWYFPLSLRPNNWWKSEIEDIGSEFTKVGGDLNDKLAKEVFTRHGWEIDCPVKGISILDKKGKWNYDACKESDTFKERIAVEVELSNRSQIFKDTFKFLIGQAMNQIDVGIIIVPKYLDKKNQPYLKWVDPNSHPIYTTFPMLKVAFYGFPNCSRKA